MPVVDDLGQSDALLDLLEQAGSVELKSALLHILLFLPERANLRLRCESHGVMKSLGVYQDDVWSYSIAPAQNWLKVWLRRPEIRRSEQIAEDFALIFPTYETNASGDYTVRLCSKPEAITFCDFIVRAAQRTVAPSI